MRRPVALARWLRMAGTWIRPGFADDLLAGPCVALSGSVRSLAPSMALSRHPLPRRVMVGGLSWRYQASVCPTLLHRRLDGTSEGAVAGEAR